VTRNRLEEPFEAAQQSPDYNPSDSGYESNDHLELFQDQFVDLICTHDGFVMLLDTAASEMVSQTSFSILLTQCSSSLRKTSKIFFQENATRFVHDRCQQTARAVWVKVQGEVDSSEEQDSGIPDRGALRASRRAIMELYLQSVRIVEQTR
jgi:hypothetical protein